MVDGRQYVVIAASNARTPNAAQGGVYVAFALPDTTSETALRFDADRCEKPVLDSQEPMILKQYYLGCLAHASYLLGDEESGTAVVVDPQRDIQQYVC